MPLLVGTSGWQYRDWRGPVYPRGVPQARWLEHFATMFATVEVNNAFYRLPSADTFAAWARRTPADFVVTVKVSRYLTHIRRLREPVDSVDLFLSRARHLGRKLGPVLLQLPPRMPAVPGLLDETLAAFARGCPGIRVAVEPRDDSWWSDGVRAVLERHNAPLVWADRHERDVTPDWRTADWGYVRLHEGGARWPCYTRDGLARWVERIGSAYAGDADVFVYFNNDPRGCAVHDAAVFGELAAAAGLAATRTPASRDIVPVEPRPAPEQGVLVADETPAGYESSTLR